MQKDLEPKSCILYVPIFKNLSKDEQDAVCLISTHQKLSKGRFIYTSGDILNSLYVIHRGKVKVSKFNDEGKEQVIRILEKGDFFGEMAIFSEELMSSTAEVIEDAVICLVDKDELKKLMVTSPELSFKMMTELSKRLVKAEELIENTNIQKAIYRVAHLLLENHKNGFVTFKTTKQNLAKQVGLTPETFSRKLKELESLGLIITLNHKTIEIVNIEQFKDEIMRF